MAYQVRLATLAPAVMLAGIAGAEAADYIPVQPITEQPIVEYAPTPYYSRVDCAAAFTPEADLRVNDPEMHFVEKNGGRIETDDTWSCGVGLGYHIHENLRVDVTYEYRGKFDIEGVADPNHLPVPPEGLLSQSTSVSSQAVLFNLYWDLDEHWGWTPYLGAGIGFAENDLEDSYVAETGFVTPGASEWDFAWALMTGASKPISPDLLFDIGYRYINVGDVASSAVPPPAAAVRVRGIDAHEVRMGFRYNFY
jgi:opacity protein-like surface antigen